MGYNREQFEKALPGHPAIINASKSELLQNNRPWGLNHAYSKSLSGLSGISEVEPTGPCAEWSRSHLQSSVDLRWVEHWERLGKDPEVEKSQSDFVVHLWS